MIHITAPSDSTSPLVPNGTKRGAGYYCTLVVLCCIWSITPASSLYLTYLLTLAPTLTPIRYLLAVYAALEVASSIYQHVLIRIIQLPAPPSELPLKQRYELLLKVLGADLVGAGECGVKDAGCKEDLGKKKDADGVVGAEEELLAHLLVPDMQMRRGRDERVDADERGGDDKTSRVRRLDSGIATPVATSPELKPLQDLVPATARLADEDGKPVQLGATDPGAVQLRERLRTWFNHAPWSTLKRDNILHWLSWSCFNLPVDAVSHDPTLTVFLDRAYGLLEARTGTTFPPGYDPRIRTIRLTLDPVPALARPLLLYALSGVANNLLEAHYLTRLGMMRAKSNSGTLDVLYRIPVGWEQARDGARYPPILYLHGLGFGLLQNAGTVKALLQQLPQHPIVVPLAHHTAQSILHPRYLRPWRRRTFVRDIKEMGSRLRLWGEGAGLGGISILSHSNGSVAHAWLLKNAPSLVLRSTFVDPVVFCLWEGDVCHSFVYRSPSTPLELALQYLIASEIGIAHYIQRHFDWADNTLFLQDIPHVRDTERFHVVLGGRDIIVDAARVRRHMEAYGVKEGRGMTWGANKGHGDSLNGNGLQRIIRFAGTGSFGGVADVGAQCS